ncbi:HlyD family efflux transporter periplasmic adaptor subunit [Photorhabdus laumondii]|uniref:HlyD family secretion protein n=1 Tax=Photorhabdus laumondii TaxID=2218628 RepID=UPI0033156492
MSDSIFRNLNKEKDENRWVANTIIKIYPSSLFLYSIVFFLIFFLFILIFALKINNRVLIEGEIHSFPSTIIIRSPIKGYIESSTFDVLKPEKVLEGDIIFRIKNIDEDINGDLKLQKIKQLNSMADKVNGNIIKKKELKIKVIEFYERSIKFTEKEIQKLSKELEESNRLIQDYNKTRKKFEDYLKKGHVTIEQLNSINNNYTQNKISYISMYQQLNSLQEKNSQLVIDRDNKLSDIENSIALLQEKENDINLKKIDINSDSTRVITSPINGILDYQYKTLGQEVTKNDVLVKISPKKIDSYFIIFNIRSDSYPYIKIGSKVNIRFSSYPFQKYGSFEGIIETISQSTVSNENSMLQNPEKNIKIDHDNFYSIKVRLTDKNINQLRLVAGMKAETSLIVESKSIYNLMVDKAKRYLKKHTE